MSETEGPVPGPVPGPVDPAAQAAGDPLGAGYRLFGRLGGGAMGEVRRGLTSSGEAVAVKILRPEFADDPAMVARFLQERSILTGLTHENVVHVRDLVAEGSTMAIVMDLVEGPDLRKELVSRGTLPPVEAAALAAGVLRGLAAVHSVGVVHRDVKPENVLLDLALHPGYTVPRVTDFGISKLVDQKSSVRRTSVIGTPEYMAPELIDDSDPTVASDLYSVGIMLYELLTGVTPFGGGSPLAVLRKHVELVAGRPEGIPDPLWAVIAGLLAKDPATRPVSAQVVAASLDAQLPALAPLPPLPRLTEAPLAQPEGATVVRSLTPTKPVVAAPPVEKKKSKRPLLVGGLLVLLLAVIGGGVLAITQRGQSEATGDAPVPSASATLSPTPSASASTTASATPSATPTVTMSSASPTPTTEPLGQMPDLVDMTIAEATSKLATMGVEVKVTEQIDSSVADGTVVAQEPRAGQDVFETAELTVGRRQLAVWLSDLAPVSGSPGGDPVNINGKNYVHTLVDEVSSYCSGYSTSWEYDLGRSFTSLAGTVGLTDRSDAQTKVVAEIYRDGTRLFAKTVSLGKPAKFKVDMTNGLRLELVMTPTKCGPDDSSVAWVNTRLTGIPTLPTSGQ